MPQVHDRWTSARLLVLDYVEGPSLGEWLASEDFEPAAVLYGDIWGEDRIFSFHPWDQSRYSTFNTENRQVRPELATNNLVVRYDATTHPDPRYRWIDQRN